MKTLRIILLAFLSITVSGLCRPITPDQELYNNLVLFHELLSDDPVAVGNVQQELRRIDTSVLSMPSKPLLAAMMERCDQVAKIERKIGHHQEDGEVAIEGRSITDGIGGGLAAAGTLAQLDYASNQKIDGSMLLYAVSGMIGGAMKHHEESKKIERNVERAVVEEREEQKRLLAIFEQDLNNFRKQPIYLKFDQELLYRPGFFAGLVTQNPQTFFEQVRRRRLAEMRIPALNGVVADLAMQLGTDSDCEEFNNAACKEWPACLSKNHPGYSMGVSNQSMFALKKGDFGGGESLADDAIKCDQKNAMAFNNRAVARMNLGKGKEALADIESAITIQPTNDWYHLTKALIFAQAFGDADRSVKALTAAYNLGLCDIAALRADPGFKRISTSRQFQEHTTVSTNTKVQNGLVFADVYLTNNSPFCLTNVTLKSQIKDWNPELKVEVVPPGETHHWSWVTQPPSETKATLTLACDQKPE